MAKEKRARRGSRHGAPPTEPERRETNAEELARERFWNEEFPAYLNSEECRLQQTEGTAFTDIFRTCKPFLADLAIAADAAQRWHKRGVIDPETREYALRALAAGMSIIADLEKPAGTRQNAEWYIGRVTWFDKQLMYAINKLMDSVAAAKREAIRHKRVGEGLRKIKTEEDQEHVLKIIHKYYDPPRVNKTAACKRAVPDVFEELDIAVGDKTLLRLFNEHLAAR